jgi:hypothetical protein
MKNKRSLIACVFLLVFTAANSHAQSSGALIGKWFFEDFFGSEFVVLEFTRTQMSICELEYYDDEDDVEIVSYQADGTTITFEGERLRYSVRNGNTLTLTDSDGDQSTGKKLATNVTSLRGKYELVNDEGFIESFEFVDGTTVRGTVDALGMGTARFTAKYRISGSRVTLSESTGGYGTIVLEIIGDSVLKGNTLGGLGDDSIFVKR